MPWVRGKRLDYLGFLQFPYNELAVDFVGIDLHKKSISVGVVGQQRQVLIRKRFACADPHRIVTFFKELELFQAVMEATSSDEWVSKLLEPLAKRVLLVHPKKVRIIAQSTP